MAYCKYCGEQVSKLDSYHECPKKGLLNIDRDDSFLVSAIIGGVTDSALLGGLLGGSLIGGVVGDLFGDGDLFD